MEAGGWRKRDSGCFLSPEDYLVLTSLWPLDWPGREALARDVPKDDVTHACAASSQQHLLRAQPCQGEGHSWPLAHAALAAAWAFSHILHVRCCREALMRRASLDSEALSRTMTVTPHPGRTGLQ